MAEGEGRSFIFNYLAGVLSGVTLLVLGLIASVLSIRSVVDVVTTPRVLETAASVGALACGGWLVVWSIRSYGAAVSERDAAKAQLAETLKRIEESKKPVARLRRPASTARILVTAADRQKAAMRSELRRLLIKGETIKGRLVETFDDTHRVPVGWTGAEDVELWEQEVCAVLSPEPRLEARFFVAPHDTVDPNEIMARVEHPLGTRMWQRLGQLDLIMKVDLT